MRLASPRSILIALLALTGYAFGGAQSDHSCAADASQIMILGMYHMGNPGQDTYNLKADDVLSSSRQKEIDEVLDRLQRYSPTKIAVEGQYNQDYWTSRYRTIWRGSTNWDETKLNKLALSWQSV